MDFAALLDGPSAGIVLGGTALATLLRCGWHDCASAGHALARLGHPRFDAPGVRAQMAVQVQEIHLDGVLRAAPHLCGDEEFDDATGALIDRRSLTALVETHEHHRDRRQAESERAVRCLAQAAELAPVFGLAGTLISLSQLASAGPAPGALTGAISMAVITTLYGLLAANLLLAPLARAIERAAAEEEQGRQEVIDWLIQQLTPELHRLPTVHAEAAE